MKNDRFIVTLDVAGGLLYSKGNIWESIETVWTSNPEFASAFSSEHGARKRIKQLEFLGFNLHVRKIVTLTEIVNI